MLESQVEVVGNFPFARGGLAPPEVYADLRAQPGLAKVRMWDGSLAWIATRYDDVRALLADNRFSADTDRPGFPHVASQRKAFTEDGLKPVIRLDPPDHGRMRRMLTKEFAYARIQALAPMIERIIDDLLTAVLAKPAPIDVVQELAFPLPSTVIAELLGIPHEAHEFFQKWSHYKVAFDATPEQVATAGATLRGFISDLLTKKKENPEAYDDIMGRMIVDWMRPGELSHDEAVTSIEFLLLAGHESTANMLALGTLSLLQNPDDFARIRQDPSVARKAVEEMLRYHTILQFTGARIAVEDVEFQGERIRAGEGILAMISAANRDPSKFPHPDQFDPDRPTMAPHVAFGFGIHQCLGQPLARLELELFFTALAKRVPTLRLAIPAEDISYRKENFVHGVNSLPVTW